MRRWFTQTTMELDHLRAEANAIAERRDFSPFDVHAFQTEPERPTSLCTETSAASDQFDVVTCDVDFDVAGPSQDSTNE